MKKGVVVIVVLLANLLLSACVNDEIVPLEDIDIELYSLEYQMDTYAIYYLSEQKLVDHSALEYLSEECDVMSGLLANLIISYKGEYYSLQDGIKLELYTAADLLELQLYGIICYEDESMSEYEIDDYEETDYLIAGNPVFFLEDETCNNDEYVIEDIEVYIYYTDIAGCTIDDLSTGIYLLMNEKMIPLDIAYEHNLVSFNDISSGLPVYRKYVGDLVVCEDCYRIDPDSDTLGFLNGYEIFRDNWACMMALNEDVYVDDFYFGHFDSGCYRGLDVIALYGVKNGVSYKMSELLELEEITAEELYNFYICYANGAYRLKESEE